VAILTEPIGSIPRPRYLLDGVAHIAFAKIAACVEGTRLAADQLEV
jgi:hypothetical protein